MQELTPDQEELLLEEAREKDYNKKKKELTDYEVI